MEVLKKLLVKIKERKDRKAEQELQEERDRRFAWIMYQNKSITKGMK